MTKKFGFTLAEVLITLGIIGVVAAMTIPTLMNQTSGAEMKTGFKKIVSTLNQAITMNVALDGNDFASLGDGVSATSAYNMFTSRMNVISTGTNNSTIGGAFNEDTNYTLFFNDGMAISFPSAAAGCASPDDTNCQIVVDVNGTKKPNILSTATDDTSKAGIKDQYVLDFFSQQVQAHDSKAKYVLFN